jgi:cytochrome c oxidase cbb3-type subunit III
MHRHIVAIAVLSLLPAASVLAQNPGSVAQQSPGVPPLHSLQSNPENRETVLQYGSDAAAMIRIPVSNLFPGGVSTRPNFQNPVANDPAAAQRGMSYFNAFNCVGCHAANGGGGMGPALSNRFFKYGDAPENIYLTIVQGRPNGMPSWGALLPDPVVWDLVAYIKGISRAQDKQWGTTISRDSPNVEQVPAEFTVTTDPWAHTQAFSHGQNPSGPK